MTQVPKSSLDVNTRKTSVLRHSSPVPVYLLWALAALIAAGCTHPPLDDGIDPIRTVPEVPSAEALPPARSRTLEIDLDTQGFLYFEDGRLVREGVISAGTVEHPTPIGRFKVLNKDKDKVSSSYTNALDMPTPMPYSMQFHGPYFIHEGWVPGYPDSHGCVRLHYEDARFLYKRMRRGDTVIVEGSGGREDWIRETPATPWPQGIQGNWIAPHDPRRHW